MTNEEDKICKLNFNPVHHTNYQILAPFLNSQDYRLCDYTLGVLHMWKKHLNYTYAICDNMLIVSSTLNGNKTFSIPLGSGHIRRALNQLETYCQENNLPLNFHGITKQALDILIKHFGERFNITEKENWGEYLYRYEDLATLKGKKYHSKRNHINQFKKLYPHYSFQQLTKQSLHRVLEFLEGYYDVTQKEHYLFTVEKNMLYSLLDSYDKLQLLGAFIEVDNRIVAFSIGECQRDTMYIHIEKADRDYKGSYAIINNEFVNYFANENIKYVNREEDAGDLGLRKAKRSYYPIEIITKYLVEEKR